MKESLASNAKSQIQQNQNQSFQYHNANIHHFKLHELKLAPIVEQILDPIDEHENCDDQTQFLQAISPKSQEKILISRSGIRQIQRAISDPSINASDNIIIGDYQMQKQSFERLYPGRWLNDECVNNYIFLINQREASQGSAAPKASKGPTGEMMASGHPQVFVFNTFFLQQLENMRTQTAYNFKKLKRTVDKKKVSLRKCRTIMIPINIKDSHWLLMSLCLHSNTFFIVDSMAGFLSKDRTESYVDLIRQFMQDYFHNTRGEITQNERKSMAIGGGLEENMTLWQVRTLRCLTRQINGSDCGLHTCYNMNLIAAASQNQVEDGLTEILNYPMTPEISEDLRAQMQVEIISGRLF